MDTRLNIFNSFPDYILIILLHYRTLLYHANNQDISLVS